MGSEVEIGNMSEIKGICPNVGLIITAGLLVPSDKQSCAKCGSALEIRRDGVLIHSVLSPLTVGTAANVVGILR